MNCKYKFSFKEYFKLSNIFSENEKCKNHCYHKEGIYKNQCCNCYQFKEEKFKKHSLFFHKFCFSPNKEYIENVFDFDNFQIVLKINEKGLSICHGSKENI